MKKQVLTCLLMLMATVAMAQKPIEMNLWPEGPKTSNGDPNDMAKVTVYLPNKKHATGRAVVCCPGGGYTHLAMNHEGFDWAPFFNGQGIALIVLALIVWVIGCIVRKRTEFAVTDTRFVQKDGIFSIKMTEIPMARIETVNFYQSFWQRIIGTGCVELVGSGGTSHQVHCIKEPMKVRKIICASIKNKPQ